MREPRSTTTPRRPVRRAVDARSTSWDAPAPTLAASLAHLHSAVARHVVGQRDAGVPLERVLTEVNDLVDRAELLEQAPDELGVLLAHVRRWSLDAYLDEPALQNAPLFY